MPFSAAEETVSFNGFETSTPKDLAAMSAPRWPEAIPPSCPSSGGPHGVLRQAPAQLATRSSLATLRRCGSTPRLLLDAEATTIPAEAAEKVNAISEEAADKAAAPPTPVADVAHRVKCAGLQRCPSTPRLLEGRLFAGPRAATPPANAARSGREIQHEVLRRCASTADLPKLLGRSEIEGVGHPRPETSVLRCELGIAAAASTGQVCHQAEREVLLRCPSAALLPRLLGRPKADLNQSPKLPESGPEHVLKEAWPAPLQSTGSKGSEAEGDALQRCPSKSALPRLLGRTKAPVPSLSPTRKALKFESDKLKAASQSHESYKHSVLQLVTIA